MDRRKEFDRFFNCRFKCEGLMRCGLETDPDRRKQCEFWRDKCTNDCVKEPTSKDRKN